ncbi:MAG: hypothetical protein WCI18_16225 [Pseudomonadota bacterium]
MKLSRAVLRGEWDRKASLLPGLREVFGRPIKDEDSSKLSYIFAEVEPELNFNHAFLWSYRDLTCP